MHQLTERFNRALGRAGFSAFGRKGPKEFQEITREHYDLAARIKSFNRQLGAAPERRGNRHFVDQTTQLGRDILQHSRELVGLVTGAKPENVTFYHLSGTGAGEPLNYLSGLYNNYVDGNFHVLRFGSFGDRIRLQAEAAGAKRRVRILDSKYGSAPSGEELMWHFSEHASNNDTITLPHLETSTAAQMDVREAIEKISRVYHEKGLAKPLFIVDGTSSPRLDIAEFDKKGYRVSVYQGTAKPITGEMMEGIVYSTSAAEKELDRRTAEITRRREEHAHTAKALEEDSFKLGEGEGERVADLPGSPLYLMHKEERDAQRDTGRARFTQPVEHIWGIANNLLHFLKGGLRGKPETLEAVKSNAFDFMDSKRTVVQDYIRESFGVLGFKPFSQAPSKMLLSLARPSWLQDSQELLDASVRLHGVAFHAGYVGATPDLWKTTVDPEVDSHLKTFRIHTYYVDNMAKELKVARLLVKAAVHVAKKHGHVDASRLKRLKEIERGAFRFAEAVSSGR